MHLTEADILLFIEKRLTGEERERFSTHLADCAECTALLNALSRLKRELPRMSAPQIPKEAVQRAERIVRRDGARESAWSWLRVPRLRFALGGLAVVAAVIFFLPDRTEVSRYRDSTNFSSTQLLDPVDGSNVQPQTAFRWRAMQEAIAYRFTLHDHVGLIQWETVSSETTITLPSHLDLKRGERYFWRVESLFPDQSSQRSQLNAFIYSQ
jgi:hypothetical protein